MNPDQPIDRDIRRATNELMAHAMDATSLVVESAVVGRVDAEHTTGQVEEFVAVKLDGYHPSEGHPRSTTAFLIPRPEAGVLGDMLHQAADIGLDDTNSEGYGEGL